MKKTKYTLIALGISILIAPAFAGDMGAEQGDSQKGANFRIASEGELDPGAVGGKGLAIFSKKIVLCEWQGRDVINNGVIMIRDGKIEAVGNRGELLPPPGYALLDVGDQWITPGLVEMHCHIAGRFGLNDMVYLANPGIRASADVFAGNSQLDKALGGGVTTVLYIPGSGTNVGGQGVLLRTGFATYEAAIIKNPGSLKLAQAGNPERWLIRPGRTFMNWNTRLTFKKGVAYAQEWEAYERDGGVMPRKDPQWEVFRNLRKRDIHISTHTQIYQVVLMTITLVHDELGLPFFIDHGTFDSYRVAEEAEKRGIFACLGPRNIDVPSASFRRFGGSNPERLQGVAAGYQESGFTRIGFNTDSPVIPQEELQLQASMAVRYGFDESQMGTLRGLTIVPAMAGGIGDQVGSLEVGKFADILITTGDITDPRHSVELVLQQGQVVYDAVNQKRRW